MKPPALPGLLRLAWPIFAEQALHGLSHVTATLLVSRLADQAVAGLSSAGQILWLLILAFSALAIGASTVISHHLGRGDAAGALRLARGAVASNLAIGLVLGLALVPAAPWLLRAAQLPPGPMAYAAPWLQWMAGTLFLESMNFGLSAVLRAHGHTRAVMAVMLVQNMANAAGISLVVLAPQALGEPGITGVALATVASRALSCAALWAIAHRLLGLRLRASDLWRTPRADLQRLLAFGVPPMLQNLSWFGAFVCITALSARMGERTLATQAYVLQLTSLVVLFGVAVGVANEILVGRLVGAGQRRAARSLALRHLRLGLLLSTSAAALAAGLGQWALPLFTGDVQIQQLGSRLLWLSLLLEPGRCLNLVLGPALRAGGDARTPLRVGLCSHWGVMALGGWLLGTVLGLGLPGVWCAFILDEWLRGLLMLRRWHSGRWLPAARRAARLAAQHSDDVHPAADPGTLLANTGPEPPARP